MRDGLGLCHVDARVVVNTAEKWWSRSMGQTYMPEPLADSVDRRTGNRLPLASSTGHRGVWWWRYVCRH